MSSATTAPTCPGLFYATPAQDGFLVRIRVPGGILTAQQCEAIAQLAEQEGATQIEITNRANLQLRGLSAPLSATALRWLQTLGLASERPDIDALRNIMGSPTAGIDPQMLLDTRPFVAAWNTYFDTRPDFAVLSPKFSVGIDGGEQVSIRDRRNDITLIAVQEDRHVYFDLRLVGQDVGIRVPPEKVIDLLAALAAAYRDYTVQQNPSSRKPRLRHLLEDWGLEIYLAQVAFYISAQPLSPYPLKFGERFPKTSTLSPQNWGAGGASARSERTNAWQRIAEEPPSASYPHLGLHPQRQAGLFYLGFVPPLGQLTPEQLQALAALSRQVGNSTLRLTPWQTALLPDLPEAQTAIAQERLTSLDLPWQTTHPLSGIVACSGITGCRAGLTDTQSHARATATHLAQAIGLDAPVNIHFSGCPKSCAQHHPAEITLVGLEASESPTYQVYVGSQPSPFGQELWGATKAEHIPRVLEQMLRQYQTHRNGAESFGAFVDQRAIADLQVLFALEGGQP